MKAYLLEEGILLDKTSEEFDWYSQCYDKVHGYYNELQMYVEKKEDAVASAKEYVEKGVENTYAIVSVTDLPDNTDFDDVDVEGEDHLVENIHYSVAKINGAIVENFVKGK